MDLIRVDDCATRAELAEAVTYLNHRAKREVPSVGNDEFPTPWDLRHRAINDMLTDYETASA